MRPDWNTRITLVSTDGREAGRVSHSYYTTKCIFNARGGHVIGPLKGNCHFFHCFSSPHRSALRRLHLFSTELARLQIRLITLLYVLYIIMALSMVLKWNLPKCRTSPLKSRFQVGFHTGKATVLIVDQALTFWFLICSSKYVLIPRLHSKEASLAPHRATSSLASVQSSPC